MAETKTGLTVTDTKLLHSGLHPQDYQGATTVPIFMSSAFAHESAEELEAIFTIENPDLPSPESEIPPSMILKERWLF